MRIRTTVTLDEDVLDKVRRECRARGKSFGETLNDLLRAALLSTGQGPTRRTLTIKPFPMGHKPGLNYDDVGALLEYGEGERYR